MSDKAIVAFKDVLKSYATIMMIKNFKYRVGHLLDIELSLFFFKKNKVNYHELASCLSF